MTSTNEFGGHSATRNTLPLPPTPIINPFPVPSLTSDAHPHSLMSSAALYPDDYSFHHVLRQKM